VVVEESVIEFWDRQDSIQPCNLMNKGHGGMNLTPFGSWRRAQQSPAIRSRIGPVVVEESVIEFWDRQDSIQPCNLMNKGHGGMNLTPLGSWRRAQQSPAIRSRIGPVVVEESDIKLWERQGIYKDNSHKGQRFPEF